MITHTTKVLTTRPGLNTINIAPVCVQGSTSVEKTTSVPPLALSQSAKCKFSPYQTGKGGGGMFTLLNDWQSSERKVRVLEPVYRLHSPSKRSPTTLFLSRIDGQVWFVYVSNWLLPVHKSVCERCCQFREFMIYTVQSHRQDSGVAPSTECITQT